MRRTDSLPGPKALPHLNHLGYNPSGGDEYAQGAIDDLRIWSRALSAAEIAANYDRSLSGNEPGLVGYWRFDETSGSSIKHVELETLKYVSSGYRLYLADFVPYSTHEPCAMCAGACVWSRIGAVVYGVSQEDIAAFGLERGTEDYKWRACLNPCRLVLEKGNHPIPVTGGFLRQECHKLFRYTAARAGTTSTSRLKKR